MRSNQIEKYKQGLKLTPKQREILIGLLLGDGHLETQNDGLTYRLKIEHCQAQKDYVKWLYNNFREWVLTPPQEKIKEINHIAVKNIWFNTVSHISFRYYGSQFYCHKRRKVPKYIGKLLKPLTLAVWFMDDGSLKSREHKALILNTQGFNKEDIERLRTGLEKHYQIEAQLRKQADGIQLLIARDSAIRFVKVIKPYLLPYFYYKLGKLD